MAWAVLHFGSMSARPDLRPLLMAIGLEFAVAAGLAAQAQPVRATVPDRRPPAPSTDEGPKVKAPERTKGPDRAEPRRELPAREREARPAAKGRPAAPARPTAEPDLRRRGRP